MTIYHELILEKTDASGIEEWYCPTCGRRFLLQWPPEYKKVILEPGDEAVAHSGGKGGLNIGGVQVVTPVDPDLEPYQRAGFGDRL